VKRDRFALWKHPRIEISPTIQNSNRDDAAKRDGNIGTPWENGPDLALESNLGIGSQELLGKEGPAFGDEGVGISMD
jgi:hypothetical protein